MVNTIDNLDTILGQYKLRCSISFEVNYNMCFTPNHQEIKCLFTGNTLASLKKSMTFTDNRVNYDELEYSSIKNVLTAVRKKADGLIKEKAEEFEGIARNEHLRKWLEQKDAYAREDRKYSAAMRCIVSSNFSEDKLSKRAKQKLKTLQEDLASSHHRQDRSRLQAEINTLKVGALTPTQHKEYKELEAKLEAVRGKSRTLSRMVKTKYSYQSKAVYGENKYSVDKIKVTLHPIEPEAVVSMVYKVKKMFVYAALCLSLACRAAILFVIVGGSAYFGYGVYTSAILAQMPILAMFSLIPSMLFTYGGFRGYQKSKSYVQIANDEILKYAKQAANEQYDDAVEALGVKEFFLFRK